MHQATLDELVSQMKVGADFISTALIIGLDGGHVLTGHMSGEQIKGNLVQLANWRKAEIVHRWSNMPDEQRAQRLASWFRPDWDKSDRQALAIIRNLVKSKALKWLIVSDCSDILHYELIKDRLISTENVIDLSDLTSRAVEYRAGLPGTKLVDAGERLLLDFKVDKRGHMFEQETYLHFINKLDAEIFLCWGWSANNSALDEFLGKAFSNNKKMFILGEDSNQDSLGALSGGSFSMISSGGGPMPSVEILKQLATKLGVADTEDTDQERLPAEETRSSVRHEEELTVRPLRVPLVQKDSNELQGEWEWLCNENVLEDVDEYRNPVILVGVDGQELRKHLAYKCQADWQKEGLHALLCKVDLVTADRTLVPLFAERPHPRSLLILAQIDLDDQFGSQVAAMQSITMKWKTEYERMVIIAPSLVVRRLTETWPDPDPARLRAQPFPVWRTASDCLSNTSFKKVLKRNRLPARYGPDSLSLLAEQLGELARGILPEQPIPVRLDFVVDRVHAALTIWLDAVDHGKDGSALDVQKLVDLWRRLLDDGQEDGQDFSLRALPREPMGSAQDQSVCLPEVQPDRSVDLPEIRMIPRLPANKPAEGDRPLR
jgi:hypothetical protein